MTEHSILSASAAPRWINCPGSVKAEQAYQDESSDAAKLGTLAHEYAEYVLTSFLMFSFDDFGDRFKVNEFDQSLKSEWIDFYEDFILGDDSEFNSVDDLGIDQNPLVRDKSNYSSETLHEIKTHVKGYIYFITDLFDEMGLTREWMISVEEKVNFTEWLSKDKKNEFFGTADVILRSPSFSRPSRLAIIDLKYGHVNVDAADNYQLMLYALGAIEIDDDEHYDQIDLWIYQPRAVDGKKIKHHIISMQDLIQFAGYARSRAEIALSDYAYKLSGDVQCKYCKHFSNCSAVHASVTDAIDNIDNHITIDEKVKIWKHKKLIVKYIDSCENDISEQIRSGDTVDAVKIVEAAGRRQFTDDAPECIKHLLGNEAFTTKLKGITEITKICKSKNIDISEIDHWLFKRKTEVLVDDSDKRESIYQDLFKDES